MTFSPFKICFYFLLTLLILLGITFLSSSEEPNNKNSTEGFFLSDIGIKYPTTSSFFMQKTELKPSPKKLDSLVEAISVIEENDKGEHEEKKQTTVQIPDFKKIDTSKIQRISYPKNRNEFISQLKKNIQSNACRIIHYGDSQLEGDRISAYLRNRLQGLYGGGGPGFIPIVQAYHQNSAQVTPSENWTRHAYFDPTQKKLTHKKYGAYYSLSRFTPVYPNAIDSLTLSSLTTTKASISIGVSNKSYALLRKFSRITFHYGNSITPTSMKVYNNGILIQSDTLINDKNYHKAEIVLTSTPTDLKIELESKISPDFYGITLDKNNGISLDNVAMRGSSGTIFTATNADNFAQMYQELNPKLLIFQYGGNSVPYLKDSLHAKQYASQVKNQILWVKSKAKNANIIFIGPSDMTTKINDQLQTYPLLQYLNSILKKECLQNGIAYWSMFDAMGGKESMQLWVNQKLAANDYTHFSPSGTKIISELFFLALYLDITQLK